MVVYFQKKQARKKSTREYIPAYRSGPYALMLTLFRQSQVRLEAAELCTTCMLFPHLSQISVQTWNILIEGVTKTVKSMLWDGICLYSPTSPNSCIFHENWCFYVFPWTKTYVLLQFVNFTSYFNFLIFAFSTSINLLQFWTIASFWQQMCWGQIQCTLLPFFTGGGELLISVFHVTKWVLRYLLNIQSMVFMCTVKCFMNVD